MCANESIDGFVSFFLVKCECEDNAFDSPKYFCSAEFDYGEWKTSKKTFLELCKPKTRNILTRSGNQNSDSEFLSSILQ